MPFTPSHVECVTPEGKWAGQRINGGLLNREPGYDKSTVAHEAFFDLPATDTQSKAFYAFVASSIGQPYDWQAILDYAVPGLDAHEAGHAICSAFMALALRKAQWFKWPLAVPAHLINPRDLLLMLSGMVEIPH